MKISILGQAITDFGELWNQSLHGLLAQAMDEAIVSAEIKPSAVQAIFVGNKAAGNFDNQHHLNALASQHFAHHPPAMRVEAACASGGLAIIAAEQALLAGIYDTVLVVGAEKMTDAGAAETTGILAGAADMEHEYGSTFPALYGILTQAHMRAFGTTREQLSAVAVKNHLHAVQNPHAQFKKELTITQVSQSSLVAEPLRLLDCSPISDGAAAVILTTKPTAHKPIITGFGHGQDTLDLAGRQSLTSLAATQKAAQAAYHRAGISAHDISLAEVHDCFTIAELLAIEDLGFFTAGEGGAATLAGKTTQGAQLVINPSGGLKACGHPVGATGVKQVAFLAEQLMSRPQTHALTHNVGGSGATAIVHILSME